MLQILSPEHHPKSHFYIQQAAETCPTFTTLPVTLVSAGYSALSFNGDCVRVTNSFNKLVVGKFADGHHRVVNGHKDGTGPDIHVFVIAGPPPFGEKTDARYDFNVQIPIGPVVFAVSIPVHPRFSWSFIFSTDYWIC